MYAPFCFLDFNNMPNMSGSGLAPLSETVMKWVPVLCVMTNLTLFSPYLCIFFHHNVMQQIVPRVLCALATYVHSRLYSVLSDLTSHTCQRRIHSIQTIWSADQTSYLPSYRLMGDVSPYCRDRVFRPRISLQSPSLSHWRVTSSSSAFNLFFTSCLIPKDLCSQKCVAVKSFYFL